MHHRGVNNDYCSLYLVIGENSRSQITSLHYSFHFWLLLFVVKIFLLWFFEVKPVLEQFFMAQQPLFFFFLYDWLQVYLRNDYNKADRIFTSCSNSCANAVSREGHSNKAGKHHSSLNKFQALGWWLTTWMGTLEF